MVFNATFNNISVITIWESPYDDKAYQDNFNANHDGAW
jgi:hypothetical protein